MLGLLSACSIAPQQPMATESAHGVAHIGGDALRLLSAALDSGDWNQLAQTQERMTTTEIASASSFLAQPAAEARQVEAQLNLTTSAVANTSSKSLQPKLLKTINSLTTKEELLGYVDHCHHLLDSINLVTVLYRLARIYSFTQAAEQKVIWKAELLENPSFTLLLSIIHQHLTQARAILCTQSEVAGLNARCISNLVWSVVKLEMTTEGGHAASALAVDVVLTAAPLVLRFLTDCSGQGLSNLLWSFAKIPTSPPSVMTAIVARMVELLERPASSNVLDAQALSNSIWAIAHVRSRPNELDSQQEWQNVVTSFLLLVANQCLNVLGNPAEANAMASQHNRQAGYSGEANDGRFSCQAVVNIAWSFSSILGSACGTQDPVRPLFLLIRQLTVARLQAILTGSSPSQPWTHTLTGSFNEQALSNVVYAFDKAQLLSVELLQAVFDMASLRLGRASTGSQGPLGFKPQELCTLLRACHLGIAQPWGFLHALSRLLAQYPSATATWTPAEMIDLHRAMQLLRSGAPTQMQSIMAPRQPLASHLPQVQSQQPQPYAAQAYAAAQHILSSGGNSPRHAPGVGMGMGVPRATPLLRHVSAPQPALIGMLQEAGLSAVDNQYGQDNTYITHMPGAHMSGAHMPNYSMMGGAAQGSPALQQVWVVDAAGNLQPTTLLLQAPPQMPRHDGMSGYPSHGGGYMH